MIYGTLQRPLSPVYVYINICVCVCVCAHMYTATHSSILAWRITWTEEPGGLQSIGSQRVHQVTKSQNMTKAT